MGNQLTGESTVWYEVIGSAIIPIDVVEVSPYTLTVVCAGERRRVYKESKGRTYVETREEARIIVKRYLEDRIRQLERFLEHTKNELVQAMSQLAVLEKEGI